MEIVYLRNKSMPMVLRNILLKVIIKTYIYL